MYHYLSQISALSGALTQDEGEIFWTARRRVSNRRSPRDMGIETVHQNLALAPSLGVADNLFLGRERRRKGLWGRLGLLDHAAMRETARRLLDDLGLLTIQSIDRPVETLSGGQRQGAAMMTGAA